MSGVVCVWQVYMTSVTSAAVADRHLCPFIHYMVQNGDVLKLSFLLHHWLD